MAIYYFNFKRFTIVKEQEFIMTESQVTCQILENSELNEVPISEEEYNSILNIQQHTLEMIAQGKDSDNILAHLCKLAEELLPNSVASIMLLNDTTGLMSVLSAPSIPQVGHDALQDLKPGEGGGSCGNAVFHNEAQYVQDTFHDSRWTDLRKIAYDFNLCSCWSMPVKNENKQPIGTFALSSFEHRSPAPFHKKLLETAASIVNIVLRNKEKNRKMKLFSTAIQNATEGIVITDTHNHIIEVNAAFEKIYHYKEYEILGKNPNIFASGTHSQSFYQEMWSELNANHTWSGENINQRADNSKIEQWMSISAIKNKQNSEVENFLAVFTDITQLKKTQAEVEFMAYHDSLTALYNKTYFEKIHKNNKHGTLILLNINNFSYINTAYGFSVGDRLLVQVASLLKTISSSKFIFRFSSDEFALYYKDKIDMQREIDSIQNYFYNHSITIENIILNLTFTYGAAYSNSALMQNSALALKQAKESGKNRSHVFNRNEDTIDQAQRESFMNNNNLLHKALDQGRIVPFFQGIRNNKTGLITKFEVLARIIDNDTIISPHHFLEPARLSGMLPEITKVIIDKSFNIMSKEENRNYSFSLNITEDDLARNYLLDYLDEKASFYKIEPSRVILEILEGVSATGKKNHIRQLNTLKREGYSLAIDDFGVEYSNFERILDLDIDLLKIDAKYIKDINENPKSYEITKAISYFAKNANVPCVAEFVHSKSVQKVVEELGIHFSQGYLFSEPEAQPNRQK